MKSINKNYFLSILAVFGFALISFANVSALPACPTINRNLYFGYIGQDVKSLQTYLYNFFGINGNETGFYGFTTRKLVKNFQRQFNISQVGAVGPVTRAAISNNCQNANPNPGGICPDIYVPVCGSLNGQQITYSNSCRQQNAGATFLYNGQCQTSTTGTAPDNCQTWYDGCNTCSRSYPGGPMACTLLACFAHNTPYCKQYFSTSVTPNLIVCTQDAKLCPNGQYVGRTGPNCQFVCP